MFHGKARINFAYALLLATVVSAGLFAFGAWRNHSLGYSYLLWNLFLAWVPLALCLWLQNTLTRKRWSSWEGIIASLAWLLFLPNSFYMISDFIHLQDVTTVDVLYDAVMFTAFIYTGVVLGFSSLYVVHNLLLKRLGAAWTTVLMICALVASSFAIYIGRDLRWNSWDVLTNPGGLLIDISDRLTSLSAWPEMLSTTISFFALLAGMYILAWRGIELIRGTQARD